MDIGSSLRSALHATVATTHVQFPARQFSRVKPDDVTLFGGHRAIRSLFGFLADSLH
jgi:hypothetical protein